jgi:hypothetical protein
MAIYFVITTLVTYVNVYDLYTVGMVEVPGIVGSYTRWSLSEDGRSTYMDDNTGTDQVSAMVASLCNNNNNNNNIFMLPEKFRGSI